MSVPCVCSAFGGQKRALQPMELVFEDLVNCSVGAGNLEELLNTKHLSSRMSVLPYIPKVSVLVSFLVAITKCLTKINLRKERFALIHCLRGLSIMAEKSWQPLVRQ